MLSKEYIKSSIFLYVILIFIVKKLNKDLRICINYRAFNLLTIKNRNALFLIRETLIKLCIVKIFNKFDIITTFNEICIKEKNVKKIAFFIQFNLFEYLIISFELYNASSIF